MHQIPTAEYRVFRRLAPPYIEKRVPIVIKADGLAVVVAETKRRKTAQR